MIKVFIVTGQHRGECFFLSEDVAAIGRGIGNNIQVKDDSVSRSHAKIVRENNKYYIQDLESKNGTWINGVAVESGRDIPVREGVPITIGNVLISVGKKCPPVRFPSRYVMDISPPVAQSPPSERRKRRREDLQQVYQLCMTLLESLDLKEICEKLLDSIFQTLVRIDSGQILLIETGTGKVKEVAARRRDRGVNRKQTYSKTLVRRALKAREAIMIPDTSKEKKTNLSDSLEGMGVKSVICVPVISNGTARGAIYLQSVNAAHGFRKDDLMFLTGLATPIALAVENALLHDRNKRAEKTLQKSRDELKSEVKKRTTEILKAKKELEELSVTDGLSGLYNYRYLIKALESEYKRAVRYGRKVSLVMIDIDYFKNLNDTFGHLCGDYVIKTVAKLLKNKVRNTDVVARYGGDELAIMLIETDMKNALEISEKLKQEIGGHRFKWQEQELEVKVSIGLATAPAVGINSTHDFIDAADRALYQAKQAGRNSIIAFSP